MIRIPAASIVAAASDRKGVTAAEYGLLMLGFIIGIGTAVSVLTPGLKVIFGKLATILPS
jgi:Flp pilus assembly pilin Flp